MRYVVVMLARLVAAQVLICVSACSTASPETGDAGAGAGSGGTAVTTAGAAGSGTSGATTNAGSAGSSATGGTSAGMSNTGGAPVAGSGNAAGTSGAPSSPELEKFSFFLTSLASIRKVSGNQDGFGGDLTFG